LCTAIVTLNAEEADDPEIPVPELVGAAVRVRLRPAWLIVTAENVASPEALVVAVAPEAMVLAEGVTVIDRLLSAALFP
jgi:hypothetical protein